MICPNCNKPVSDGAKFCSGCGFKIEAAAPAEPAMPTATAVEQPAPAAQPVMPAAGEYVASTATAVEQPAPAAQPVMPAEGEYVAPTATAVEQPAPAAQPVMPAAGEYVAPTATAVEQPAPAAQPVMPAEGEYVAPAAAVETTKAKAPKSGKKFPVIPVAAAGAAVVVAGAVGLGLTVFKADVTHTFMGDEKYAVSALQKATSGITDNAAPMLNTAGSSVSAMSAQIGSAAGNVYDEYDKYISDNPDNYMDYSTYSQLRSISALASAMAGVMPENGLSATVGVTLEPSDELCKLIADEAGMEDSSKISALAKAISGIDVSASVNGSDSGIGLSGSVLEEGKKLGEINGFYDISGKLYLGFPGITDYYMTAEIPNADAAAYDVEDGDEGGEAFTVDEKELKKLFDELSETYQKNLKDAEITYDNVQVTVGKECEFKGKSIKVVFDNEGMANLANDIIDVLSDSDLVYDLLSENYGLTSEEIKDGFSELRDSADEIEDSEYKLEFVIEHYMNSNDTVAGFNYSVSGKSADEKNSVGIQYLSGKKSSALAFSMNNKDIVVVENVPESKTEGTIKASFKGKNFVNAVYDEDYRDGIGENGITDVIVNIKYTDLNKATFLEKEYMTGNFTVSADVKGLEDFLNSNGVDDESKEIILNALDTKLQLSVSDDNGAMKESFGISNSKYGKFSIDYKLEEGGSAPASAAAYSDASKAINADNTEDAGKMTDFQIELLDYAIKTVNESTTVKLVAEAFDADPAELVETLQTERDRLEAAKNYVTVYADYNESTKYLADNAAYYIYDNLYYYSEGLASGDLKTVKLYFDADGKVKVIDNAGEKEDRFTNLEGITQNAYAEVWFWGNKDNSVRPIGISVAMTDSASVLPKELPNAYNFIDRVYEWEGEQGYIGSHVVGTYPNLDTGVSTYEETLRETANRVSSADESAKQAFDAFNSFIGIFQLDDGVDCDTISFRVSDGEWSSYGSSAEYYFKGEADGIYDYMQTRVSGIEDAIVYCNIYKGNLIGVSINLDNYFNFSIPAFVVGETSDWGIMEGVFANDGSVIGTYPKMTNFDGKLSDNIIDMITGTWQPSYGSDTITLTKRDFSDITVVTDYNSGYNDTVRFVTSDDKSYDFNFEGDMGYDYSVYHKE